MAISLEVAQQQLNNWIECSTAIAKNQSYKIGDRTFTRANLDEVNSALLLWEKKVELIKLRGSSLRRGISIRRGVVLD